MAEVKRTSNKQKGIANAIPFIFFETVLFFDNILYICSHNKLIRERGNYYERK